MTVTSRASHFAAFLTYMSALHVLTCLLVPNRCCLLHALRTRRKICVCRMIPYLEDKYSDRKKLGKPDDVDKV